MKRVLYVDDETSLLDIGKLYLEWTKEFSVTTAPSAADALTLLKTNTFHAIVSDYQMPGMDGIAFLKQVRSRCGDVPFILFTGKGREDVVIEAINNGADFYIQKGGDAKSQFAELVHKIRKAVDRKQTGVSPQESEERYRVFIDSSDDMAFLKDARFRYLMVNPALAAFFGKPETEILNKTDFDLMPEQNARICQISDKKVFDSDTVIITEEDIGDRTFETHKFRVALHDGTFGIGGYIKDITECKQMSVALRINSAALASSINAIAFADMEARLTYVNQSFLQMWGYDALQEVLGKPVVSFWNDDIDVMPVLAALQKTGQWTGELRARRHDGTIFDAHLSASVIRDEMDNPLCMMASFIDVTKRKRAENAVRESEDKYRNLADNLPDYIFIHRDGKILYANRAAFDQAGIPPEKLLGRSLMDFVAPESRAVVKEQIERRLKGEPVGGYEAAILVKNGEKRCGLVNSAMISYEGAPASLVVISDITEHKLLEGALRESEEVFREVFNNAQDAIFLHEMLPGGLPGRYFRVNDIACTRLGYTREQLYTMSPSDIVTPQHRALMPGIAAKLQSEGYATFEGVHQRKDGSTFPVEISTHLFTLQGRPVGLSIARDITTRKASETALNESERKVKDIISFLPDATFVIDKTGTIVAWNRAMEEMTGFPAEQMIGKADYEYAIPFYHKRRPITIDLILRDDPAVFGKYPVIKQEGKSLYSEIFIPHLNKGRGAHLWFKASPIYDAFGNITGAIESIRDITERKHTEEALHESEERFRAIFHSASDAIHINKIEPNFKPGKFIDVNDVACQMLKMTREEILNHTPLDFATEYHNPPLSEILQLFTTKGNATFETGHRRSDGVIVPVEINSHIINLQGKTVLLGIIRDITERKQAENALHESEIFNRSLVENLPDYIIVYESPGTILYVNPATERVLGYTAEELVGTSVLPHIAENHREMVRSQIEARKNGGEVPIYETDLATRDGHRRSVIIKGTPVQFRTRPAFLILMSDITERRQAEEALRQANRQLNLLSSITRHDIKNQLFALSGYIELSRDAQKDPEKFLEYLSKAEKAASVIDEQITFTRDYQELGAAAPSWQDVNAGIKKAITKLPMRDVHVEVDPSHPVVFADPLFEKVFYNLIDNALKYGGAGMKTIRVLSKESEQGLFIFCQDDGVGISADDKKKLFTRGFGKNTGLGLFLSREILGITGITITENGEPGKGARFEIVVPKGAWRFTHTDTEK